MITRIVIHCSATPPSMDIGAAEIDRWHRDRGFDRIGYNYVGRRDGRVEIGRAEGEALAHARGFNTGAIAYCLVGGVNDFGAPAANYTSMQEASLRAFVQWMRLKYPQADFCGHRDLDGVMKDCPSFDVAHWLAFGKFINPRKQV